MPRQTSKKDSGLKAFKSSLNELVKHAQGKKAKVGIETVVIHIKGHDVKEARKALHASQPEFAQLLQVSTEAVKKWEQDVNPVPGAVSRWVQAALRHPKAVKSLLTEVAALSR